MNVKKKKMIYSLLGAVLAATAICQVMDNNELAVFPLIGSIAFFITAYRMKDE